METDSAEISVNGRVFEVPSIRIDGKTIVITGTWVRKALIHDEVWQTGAIEDPERLLLELRRSAVTADLFSFAQKLPDTKPRYDYVREWDNVAAIPITTYADWWENRLPQETRKNVRRAQKRGVSVRPVVFDDVLVRGIKGIYDETPVRQGKRFWHYGKDLESVKRENSSYLERSAFVGAFYQDQLIGFLKMVFVGKVCTLMQILSRNQHYDKRPTNALLAKAVEICDEKGMSYLVYGQYVYGNTSDGPLLDFKRRNGFERIDLPRYYVPLTLKGRIYVQCRLHRGLRRFLPGKLERLLLRIRAKLYAAGQSARRSARAESSPQCEQGLAGQQD